MNDVEKKLPSRSNTRKTRKRKLKNLGYAGAISAALLLSSCGNSDSDLTKLSKEHDDAVGNVMKEKEELKEAQENVKEKQEELKEAQENVKEKQQDIIDAQKEEAELRIKLQQAKVNPEKE